MSRVTSDRNDPGLGFGVDQAPGPQNDAYLVIEDGQFVRPIRTSYIHVGYDGHEVDPNNPSKHGRTGSGCGVETTMSRSIAETYARYPSFYGATYCVGCQMHLPVGEFKWSNTDEVVGS